jgi:hypothetical protein
MGRSAARTTTGALAAVAAVVALALLACAVPAVQAKLPRHEDRNVLCEACNATLVELAAMVKKTEKKFGRGASCYVLPACLRASRIRGCDACAPVVLFVTAHTHLIQSNIIHREPAGVVLFCVVLCCVCGALD